MIVRNRRGKELGNARPVRSKGEKATPTRCVRWEWMREAWDLLPSWRPVSPLRVPYGDGLQPCYGHSRKTGECADRHFSIVFSLRRYIIMDIPVSASGFWNLGSVTGFFRFRVPRVIDYEKTPPKYPRF